MVGFVLGLQLFFLMFRYVFLGMCVTPQVHYGDEFL